MVVKAKGKDTVLFLLNIVVEIIQKRHSINDKIFAFLDSLSFSSKS